MERAPAFMVLGLVLSFVFSQSQSFGADWDENSTSFAATRRPVLEVTPFYRQLSPSTREQLLAIPSLLSGGAAYPLQMKIDCGPLSFASKAAVSSRLPFDRMSNPVSDGDEAGCKAIPDNIREL